MIAKARTNIRAGKIAALPEALREEVNRRLMDGQHGPEIVDWLNGLQEVQVILAEKFEGKPILRQNLSYWIRGGHQDWKRARRHAAETRKLVDYTLEHARANNRPVTVEAAEMAAGMMLGLLAQMSLAFQKGEKRSKAGALEMASDRRRSQPARAKAVANEESEEDRRNACPAVVRCVPLDPTSDFAPAELQADGREGGAAETASGGAGSEDEGPAFVQLRRGERVENEMPEGGLDEGAGEPVGEEAEMEHHALEQRLGLMNRAVTGITQLRKREQADMAMELKRERLKQTQEMVNLHRERLKFQAKVHEDKLALQKKPTRKSWERPSGGGISDETLKEFEEKFKMM